MLAVRLMAKSPITAVRASRPVNAAINLVEMVMRIRGTPSSGAGVIAPVIDGPDGAS